MNHDTIDHDFIIPFLKRYYWEEILELSTNYPDKTDLTINYDDLNLYNQGSLIEYLEKDPDLFLMSVDNALREIDIPIEVDLINAKVRIINYPIKIPLSSLRKTHINSFISVEGIISQVQDVKPKATEITFQCLRCEAEMSLPQTSKKLVEPMYCENDTCGRKGPFKEVVEKTQFIDTQNIILQEPPESLKGKTNPDTLDIYLEGSLVGDLNAGDRIILNGVLKAVSIIGKEGKTPYYDYILIVNSYEKLSEGYEDIEITEQDIEQIKQIASSPNLFPMLIQSITPAIKGYETIKEALALQLFGGTTKILADGTTVRGNSHILIVGDPGVAKSQMLRYMAALSPRGRFASGKGSSTAGLTAAAIKDEFGRWALQAGVLVLADQGLAAIDEMDKMSNEDKSALHEVMEQQTITINKAGINVTLMGRVSVLGAANPKYGRFDKYESIVQQVNLPPALISRFDLIFLVLDIPDAKRDEAIANHILLSHQEGIEIKIKKSGLPLRKKQDSRVSLTTPSIPIDLLKKYVAYSRRTVIPHIPNEVIEQLKAFYMSLRTPSTNSSENTIHITARQLEGLVRLTEASARIRLSPTADKTDVERTIRLVMDSMDQTYKDPVTGQLDIDIISSGTSKSQRDKIKITKEVIKSVSEKHPGGKAPIEEIINELQKHQIDRPHAEELIVKLRHSGDLLKPDNDHLKLV
jgi:replicative DNA helicase Mcm